MIIWVCCNPSLHVQSPEPTLVGEVTSPDGKIHETMKKESEEDSKLVIKRNAVYKSIKGYQWFPMSPHAQGHALA
jgi:hypothetical protein